MRSALSAQRSALNAQGRAAGSDVGPCSNYARRSLSGSLPPLLPHPTLEGATEMDGSARPPDILSNRSTGMYDPDTGGTPAFDRPNALRRSDGDFYIPEGVDIPPGSEAQERWVQQATEGDALHHHAFEAFA
ncbi:hypothetical protein [Dyella ginsengisoli]|uniref:hypothetical protein n=1 Tax=Dyella ginsengisoli TaxID=363848 RepID=UPI00241084A6|nr:hypothetical protein [Dyella ginsengisoli]